MNRFEADLRDQHRRLCELSTLRLQRPLTDAEAAEEARLETRLYHRTYRATVRAEARRIDAAAAAAARPVLEITA